MTRDDSVEEECPRYRRVLGNEITSASLSLNESAVLKKKKQKLQASSSSKAPRFRVTWRIFFFTIFISLFLIFLQCY